MSRVRWLLGGVAAVVTVAGLALGVVVPAYLDSEALRAEVRRTLSAQLGRDVSFASLRVQVLPVASVVVGDLAVEDVAGGPPMATVRRCALSVRLLPLLDGVVVVDAVELEGPSVRVVRATDGRWNVLSLGAAAGGETVTTETQPGGTATAVVKVTRVGMEDGSLTVVDQGTGLATTLTGMTLTATDVGPSGVGAWEASLRVGEGTLRARGRLAGVDAGWQETDVDVDVEGELDQVGLAGLAPFVGEVPWLRWEKTRLSGRLRVAGRGRSPLRVEVDLRATPLALDHVETPARLSGHAELSATADELSLRDVVLGVGGSTARVQGTVRGVRTAPTVDLRVGEGRVALAEVGHLLAGVGVPLPQELDVDGAARVTATVTGGAGTLAVVAEVDGTAARVRFRPLLDKPAGGALAARVTWSGDGNLRASGRVAGAVAQVPSLAQPFTGVGARFDYTGRTVVLRDLAASLQGGTWTGGVTVKLGRKVEAETDVTVDRVDLDALLAAGDDAPPGQPATVPRKVRSKGSDAATSVKGKLHAGRVTWRGVVVEAVEAEVRLADGVLRVDPVTGRVLGGRVRAGSEVDLRGTTVTHVTRAALEDVDVAALAASQTGLAGVVGGRLTTEATVRGNAGEGAARSLAGEGSLRVEKARWVGAAAFEALVPTVAKATGARLSPLNLGNVQRITGPYRLENGRVVTDALVLERDNGVTTLKGWVGLDGTMDVLGVLTISPQASRAMEGDWEFLKDDKGAVNVPFALKGSSRSPVLAPDVARLVALYARWQARQQLKGVLGAGRQGNTLSPQEEKLIDAGTGVLMDVLGAWGKGKKRK
jgi:hypothetical protein